MLPKAYFLLFIKTNISKILILNQKLFIKKIIVVENIKILNEGQEGKGILLEKDAGFITTDLNKDLLKENNEIQSDGDSIFIKCILQKAGVLNRNGRIYPKQVLERELLKYLESVKNGNAIGEQDHADCCDSSSHILTKEGWKSFKDIKENEEILTLNPETKEIEIQTIDKKIEQDYNGVMFHFKNRNLDKMVTPNHRFLLEDRYGKKRFFVTAEEIFNDRTKYNKCKILKDGIWNGITDEYIKIPALSDSENIFKKKNVKLKYSQDLILKTKDFFALMGIYLAEGHCNGTVSKKFNLEHHCVIITQKKEKGIILIKELVESLSLKNKIYVRKNGVVDFKIYDARLYNYLWKLGNCYEKYIPVELKQYDAYFLNILFQWFLIGDGRKIKTKHKDNNDSYVINAFSTSRKLIEDLHEVLLKSGGSGNLRTEERNKDVFIIDHLVKGENISPMHFLTASFSKHIYLDNRMVTIEKVDYNDKIYCVNVKNGTFMLMRNGKTCWTGNSLSISLKNICFRLTKIWWEGETAFGELQIFMTKGYTKMGICSTAGDQIAELLRYGVKIGISSRGLGSVKTIGGKNIVQNDFELVCFDLVASPSTPNAYLFQETSTIKESYSVKKNSELEVKLKRFIQI